MIPELPYEKDVVIRIIQRDILVLTDKLNRMKLRGENGAEVERVRETLTKNIYDLRKRKYNQYFNCKTEFDNDGQKCVTYMNFGRNKIMFETEREVNHVR
jgi:hypothetical protein